MVNDSVRQDRRPTLAGVASAVLAATATTVLLWSVHPIAGGLAAIGTLALGFAAGGGARRQSTMGVGLLLVAVLVGGVGGGPPELVVATAILVVVAWDGLAQARDLGRQIGRRAETIRSQLAHSAGTLIGGTIAAGATVGVYRSIPGGWPLTALALVFLGAALLMIWLEN